MTRPGAAGGAELDLGAPVVIGGSGGSGTRLVAALVRSLGVFLGHDLNGANDNLWFTLLMKRPTARASSSPAVAEDGLRLLTKAMTSDDPLNDHELALVEAARTESPRPHGQAWLSLRAEALISRPPPPSGTMWGWKEPNSHIFIDRLVAHYPRLRYIHVVRHGLDMALSSNQQQFENWHRYFDLPAPPTTDPPWPREALRFWAAANHRAIQLGSQLGDRFMLLNYDDLCTDHEQQLPRLARFVLGPGHHDLPDELTSTIAPPESIGRWRSVGLDAFHSHDVARVEAMGFDTAS